LSAIALFENSRKSALQLPQFVSVSGEDELQREQVCTAGLLEFFNYCTLGAQACKGFSGDFIPWIG
jgi:hypothetical protein